MAGCWGSDPPLTTIQVAEVDCRTSRCNYPMQNIHFCFPPLRTTDPEGVFRAAQFSYHGSVTPQTQADSFVWRFDAELFLLISYNPLLRYSISDLPQIWWEHGHQHTCMFLHKHGHARTCVCIYWLMNINMFGSLTTDTIVQNHIRTERGLGGIR